MEIKKKNDAFVISDNTVKSGWEKWFLLTSDNHFDSKLCDRKLLKNHFEQAKKKDAGILIFGDWYDAMGGKYDKRSSKGDLRPEYNTDHYFTSITEDSAKWFDNYPVMLFTTGNHEQSVKSRHEFDLLRETRSKCQNKFEIGKYSGFIRFQFSRNDGGRKSFVVYYTHGSGGNAPVTKGSIQSARRQDSVDADIYVSGHIHTEYIMPRPRVYLNEQCNTILKNPTHIQLGTYKNEFLSGGWADSKGFAPPSLGSQWLRFYYEERNIKYQIIKAQ